MVPSQEFWSVGCIIQTHAGLSYTVGPTWWSFFLPSLNTDGDLWVLGLTWPFQDSGSDSGFSQLGVPSLQFNSGRFSWEISGAMGFFFTFPLEESWLCLAAQNTQETLTVQGGSYKIRSWQTFQVLEGINKQNTEYNDCIKDRYGGNFKLRKSRSIREVWGLEEV
jgi:hypothetical protein